MNRILLFFAPNLAMPHLPLVARIAALRVVGVA